MIAWEDGLERSPDGVCRQLPQTRVWSSTVWVTKAGVARRRYYNAGTWAWNSEPYPLVVSEEGHVGIVVGSYLSLERAIALAWRRRHPDSNSNVHMTPGRPYHAKYIRWDVEEEPEDDDIPGETWQPLDHCCGIVRCDRRYLISSHGRLKSPHTGAVTRGHVFHGQRWAACKGAGLVPLDTRRTVVYLPPYLAQARQALITGHTPADLRGIAESTAWSYMCRAAETISSADLQRLVPRLVSKGLWRVLQQRKELGGPLKPLMDIVVEKLPGFARTTEPMSQLRLARLAILATRVRPA